MVHGQGLLRVAHERRHNAHLFPVRPRYIGHESLSQGDTNKYEYKKNIILCIVVNNILTQHFLFLQILITSEFLICA